MKQKSLIKNALFNFMYTGLNLLFPLISAPYVSRVLGAANLGKVQFATSIVNWFVLFAVFGTSTYGIREVAKNRDDKKELSKIFSEIMIINGILSIIAVVIYFFLVFNIEQFNKELPLFLIMSLSILLNMFALDWFYQGIEEYSYITIRNAIFKMVSLISIFIFVKNPQDYLIYGLISVLSISLSGILNYIYSKKYIKFTFKNINIFRHMKSLSIFFINTLVINSYSNLDKTLLGFYVNTTAVAFMARSTTVTNMGIAVSKSISNVAMPRSSYYLKHDKEKYSNLLKIVPQFIMWITMPITFGIIVLSPNIMFILGGDEFLDATLLLQITSIIIIFSSLSTYLQSQIIIPNGNERIGLWCSVVASVVSILLNIILIPKFSFIGSGIAVVVAEMFSMLTRYYVVKKVLNYSEVNLINKSSTIYLIVSLLMGLLVVLIQQIIGNVLLSFFVSAFAGFVFYVLTLFILKEKVTMIMLKKLKILR